MVGMGAMVGGGTGAVMTAVTMIFEMTRDYDIVMPMIIAVAFSVGMRRLLSRENIYTLKLYRRGHFVPKALHANMFLVRRAREVMDTDFAVLPAETSFAAFLRAPDHRRPHAACRRDRRRPHRRRPARQYQPAPGARRNRGGRRRHARRAGHPQFRRRARRRGHVRRDPPHAGGATPSWPSWSARNAERRAPATCSASSPRTTSPTRWRPASRFIPASIAGGPAAGRADNVRSEYRGQSRLSERRGV